jgi:AcrR family transcriptional regulator
MASNLKKAASRALIAEPVSVSNGVSALPDLFGRRVESPSIRRLLLAGVDSFWKDGFHASSTRDIAKKAKLSPAAVYVHFKSKEELLFTIIVVIAERLQEQLIAVETEGGSPTERLRRIVQTYVTVPARLHKAAHVANSEFDSLSATQRKQIVKIRDRIDGILEDCLEAGIASGEFRIRDVGVVKMAIISLCQSVLVWYSPRGKLTPEEIGDIYAELALKMVAKPAKGS